VIYKHFASWLPALTISIAACMPMGMAGGITNVDRGRMEEVLDVVSKDVQKNFYDPKLRGLDWKALTDKSRERIRKAENTGEMIAAIYALLYQLNDSHTLFIPPGRTEVASYGFKAEPVGNDILVYKLTKNGPAEQAGLQLGDKILGVNNFAAKRDNFFTIIRYFELLNPATEMDVLVARGSGSATIKIPTKLERRWANVEFNTWTYNEARRQLDSGEAVYTQAMYDGSVGYLGLHTFMIAPDEVRFAVAKVKDAHALIIDLRDNGGGSTETLTTLLGLLLNEPHGIGTMVFRSKSQPIKVKPARPSIEAPIVVLVDSSSASASEIFARSLQIQKRGVVLGDKTSGRVNVAEMFSESIGAEFKIDFGVEIAVARAVMANGEELEGNGVTPDEFCVPTRDDLSRQKDPCLERAIALARNATISSR
jgi:carboxyl-terminal processing protease